MRAAMAPNPRMMPAINTTWATLAQVGDRVVAGALLLQRGQHLYGRYWGALEEHDGLHFELCYYRPIELCIQQGWTRFEAGAPVTVQVLDERALWRTDRGFDA